MLRLTVAVLSHANYKLRLKSRMVGFKPKVVQRKLKNCAVALRSEAHTAYFVGHYKHTAERLDSTGRKLQVVKYDPIVQRYTVFKESKLHGPFLTRAHIQPKAAWLPWVAATPSLDSR